MSGCLKARAVPLPELVEHSGGTCLVNIQHHIGYGRAEYGREVRDCEFNTEQCGCSQHVPGCGGDEIQPVRDGGGQRIGHCLGGELRGASRGDRDAAGTAQGGEQLGQVERVACGALCETKQPGVRLTARELPDKLQ